MTRQDVDQPLLLVGSIGPIDRERIVDDSPARVLGNFHAALIELRKAVEDAVRQFEQETRACRWRHRTRCIVVSNQNSDLRRTVRWNVQVGEQFDRPRRRP